MAGFSVASGYAGADYESGGTLEPPPRAVRQPPGPVWLCGNMCGCDFLPRGPSRGAPRPRAGGIVIIDRRSRLHEDDDVRTAAGDREVPEAEAGPRG